MGSEKPSYGEKLFSNIFISININLNGFRANRYELIELLIYVYTANEGPVRIQYKCLVPIYVYPEMKLCSLVISKIEL